jgi:hypothetical protein
MRDARYRAARRGASLCCRLFFEVAGNRLLRLRTIRRQHPGQLRDIDLRLPIHGLGMAERLEPIKAVIIAHAAWPDTPKRQVFLRNVENHVVNGHTA